MGHVYVRIGLGCLTGDKFRYYTGLIDTGATKTVLPSGIAKELGIEKGAARSVMTGNGPAAVYEGTARLEIEGSGIVSPIWISDQVHEVVIGVTTLELMGLAVDPREGKLKKGEFLFYKAVLD